MKTSENLGIKEDYLKHYLQEMTPAINLLIQDWFINEYKNRSNPWSLLFNSINSEDHAFNKTRFVCSKDEIHPSELITKYNNQKKSSLTIQTLKGFVKFFHKYSLANAGNNFEYAVKNRFSDLPNQRIIDFFEDIIRLLKNPITTNNSLDYLLIAHSLIEASVTQREEQVYLSLKALVNYIDTGPDTIYAYVTPGKAIIDNPEIPLQLFVREAYWDVLRPDGSVFPPLEDIQVRFSKGKESIQEFIDNNKSELQKVTGGENDIIKTIINDVLHVLSLNKVELLEHIKNNPIRVQRCLVNIIEFLNIFEYDSQGSIFKIRGQSVIVNVPKQRKYISMVRWSQFAIELVHKMNELTKLGNQGFQIGFKQGKLTVIRPIDT